MEEGGSNEKGFIAAIVVLSVLLAGFITATVYLYKKQSNTFAKAGSEISVGSASDIK